MDCSKSYPPNPQSNLNKTVAHDDVCQTWGWTLPIWKRTMTATSQRQHFASLAIFKLYTQKIIKQDLLCTDAQRIVRDVELGEIYTACLPNVAQKLFEFCGDHAALFIRRNRALSVTPVFYIIQSTCRVPDVCIKSLHWWSSSSSSNLTVIKSSDLLWDRASSSFKDNRCGCWHNANFCYIYNTSMWDILEDFL